MGSGSFDRSAYRAYSASTESLKRDEIFASRGIKKELDPKGVKVRESRDSADNPASTPIIVGLDVTGSMGMIAEAIARKGLGTLFENILDKKPVTDPHLMFMAIGDATCDVSPLQVSQFEADNRIVQQLTDIYLESGGGGNNFESYNLPWYFAAYHTVHDAMEKRGRRGYLFTAGDECSPEDLTNEQIERICGAKTQESLKTADLLLAAQRVYDVFHIVIKEGNYARHFINRVKESWGPLLGQRLIVLDDHKLLAETIVSAIEIAEGAEHGASASRWGGEAARIVGNAVGTLPKGGPRPALGGPSA